MLHLHSARTARESQLLGALFDRVFSGIRVMANPNLFAFVDRTSISGGTDGS